MKKLLLSIVFIIFLVPFAAWAMFKPVRILVPEWNNEVSCISSILCLEDASKFSKANDLYNKSLQHVSTNVGQFSALPKMVFCSTESCFQYFGFKNSKASTVSSFGIVISPRGWKKHIISHEMIHHRQAEELGIFSALNKPEWLIEGMAYSLSQDPRDQLSEKWESARSKFNLWYQSIEKENLWEASNKL